MPKSKIFLRVGKFLGPHRETKELIEVDTPDLEKGESEEVFRISEEKLTKLIKGSDARCKR